MRIVAGRFRGRAITSGVAEGTRPTSDRVREAIFNVLAHGLDRDVVEGAHVLDLFAGTGALTLEAMSRGAGSAVCVEQNAKAFAALKDNVSAFGLASEVVVRKADATRFAAETDGRPFSVIFLDPPYGRGLAEAALLNLAASPAVAASAIAVIEEAASADVALPAPWSVLQARTYGGTTIRFAQYVGDVA
ncbi:MAG: 16S rRNA (guanine(966)-N(2))-methyltransferase RsmD [Pseudomonadota bacterium]